MISRLQPVLLILSVLLVVAFPLAGLGARWDWWNYKVGLALLVGIGLTAAVVLALAGVLLLLAVRQQKRALQNRLSLVVGLLLIPLGVLFYFGFQAGQVPMIHDISTDSDHPPQFVVLEKERPEDSNNLIRTEQEIALQQEAYPDLGPLRLTLTKGRTMELALRTAAELGWVVADVNAEAGRLEATDQTFWFGFIDDIVVRVKQGEGSGSVIDVRSVSRVGKSDLGKNAARIRLFLERLQQLANSPV